MITLTILVWTFCITWAALCAIWIVKTINSRKHFSGDIYRDAVEAKKQEFPDWLRITIGTLVLINIIAFCLLVTVVAIIQ